MNEVITLGHGNGGRFMRELIRDVFLRHHGDLLTAAWWRHAQQSMITGA